MTCSTIMVVFRHSALVLVIHSEMVPYGILGVQLEGQLSSFQVKT